MLIKNLKNPIQNKPVIQNIDMSVKIDNYSLHIQHWRPDSNIYMFTVVV